MIRRTTTNSYECDVVRKINLFKEVKCDFEEDIAKVATKHKSIDDFDQKYPVRFETDYYVDVRVKAPFYFHGSGTGIYGALFSFITLGIIPMYQKYEGDYEIRIYSKNDRVEIESVEYFENYGAISSSLFWLIPSSRYENINYRKNYMVRNKWEYILKEVVKKIINNRPGAFSSREVSD